MELQHKEVIYAFLVQILHLCYASCFLHLCPGIVTFWHVLATFFWRHILKKMRLKFHNFRNQFLLRLLERKIGIHYHQHICCFMKIFSTKEKFLRGHNGANWEPSWNIGFWCWDGLKKEMLWNFCRSRFLWKPLSSAPMILENSSQ